MDDALARVLGEHAARHEVPGAALAVLRDGEVREAYWGVGRIANGEPVSAETRFPIGSLTKPVTAAGLAMLAAAGRLSFDDAVSDHLSELRGSRWGDEATVRDLLANRARVPLRAAWEFELEGDGPDALQRCVELVADAGPAAPVWSYSNLGWCLAGSIIERITGRLWEDATRDLVLAPAGMSRTTFAGSAPAEPRADGHQVLDGQPVPVDPWHPRIYCSAGTSLLSTVGDLLRFVTWQFEEPSCQALWETQAEIAIHGWLDAWCLGWARFDWSDTRVIGWDGLLPGHRVVLRILPERRTAIALTLNADTGRGMYRSLFTEWLPEWFGIEMPPLQLEPSAGAAGSLERYEGTYSWPDRRCHVTIQSDRIVLDIEGRVRDARPTGDGVFVVDPDDPDNPTITFDAFDELGRPHVLYLMLWGLPREGSDPHQAH